MSLNRKNYTTCIFSLIFCFWIFNVMSWQRNRLFDNNSWCTLNTGKTQQLQTTNKIADSFPGMDGYIQAPLQQQAAGPVSVDLSKPPKWLKRPVGASFGVSTFISCNNHTHLHNPILVWREVNNVHKWKTCYNADTTRPTSSSCGSNRSSEPSRYRTWTGEQIGGIGAGVELWKLHWYSQFDSTL